MGSTQHGEEQLEFSLIPDDEFGALSLEVGSMATLKRLGKYPAKLHARKVAAELGAKEGVIYLQGEPTKHYLDSDQGPTFRQRRYFYYMTGADFADCSVTYEIADDRLILWIPYIEPRQVLYFGNAPSASEALQRYDIDDARYNDQLPKFLHDQLRPTLPLFILHPSQEPPLVSFTHRGRAKMSRAAVLDDTSLRPAMDAARVIKTEYEVALIRRANEVSSAAHRNVAEQLLSLKNEQEVEAIFLATSLQYGAHSQSYAIIAGAGENASTLHYDANNEPLAGKQLLVIDAGAEWDCYASDVTRTLPVPGSFSPEAGAIHEIVQQMQEETIKMVTPGIRYYKLQVHAARVALRGLLKLGILEGDEDDIAEAGTVSAFFPHGLGHHVGLEVHDVSGRESLLLRHGVSTGQGKRSLVTDVAIANMTKLATQSVEDESESGWTRKMQRLQPNMIVTIEPGIYFCKNYIEGYYLGNPKHAQYINQAALKKYYPVGGCRIEDCILVTEDGYDNLTSAPKGQELLDVINGDFEEVRRESSFE